LKYYFDHNIVEMTYSNKPLHPLKVIQFTQYIFGLGGVIMSETAIVSASSGGRRALRAGSKSTSFYWYCDDYVDAYLQDPRKVYDSNTSLFPMHEHILSMARCTKRLVDAKTFVTCPSDVPDDVNAWQYELLRFFTSELNQYVVPMGEVCTTQSCPVMKATDEWIYLCASHAKPKECSAPDYMLHTLDGTSAYLTSTKWFPSRASILKGSAKAFPSIARRLYRIFAHAYYHHRQEFDNLENETHLCERFTRFCEAYALVPRDLLIVPESAFSNVQTTSPTA
jgi:hypothetical protein